jgi:hypothetical protein
MKERRVGVIGTLLKKWNESCMGLSAASFPYARSMPPDPRSLLHAAFAPPPLGAGSADGICAHRCTDFVAKTAAILFTIMLQDLHQNDSILASKH